MEDFINAVKIPLDRVAVLIGKNGEAKEQIEKAAGISLNIDSKEGDVHISGADPLALFTGGEIVRAIGRGFNPDVALYLKKMDFVLDVLSITDFAKSLNDATRLKGRVIGKDGKARRVIEDLLGVNIIVYGKTISIIGRGESVSVARRAVESLLSGSPHANVYRFLEKQRSLSRQRDSFGTGISEE